MSVKCETIVFGFKGQQIYLIFQLSTNFIDHNDKMDHFIKRFSSSYFKGQCQKGDLILLHSK